MKLKLVYKLCEFIQMSSEDILQCIVCHWIRFWGKSHKAQQLQQS